MTRRMFADGSPRERVDACRCSRIDSREHVSPRFAFWAVSGVKRSSVIVCVVCGGDAAPDVGTKADQDLMTPQHASERKTCWERRGTTRMGFYRGLITGANNDARLADCRRAEQTIGCVTRTFGRTVDVWVATKQAEARHHRGASLTPRSGLGRFLPAARPSTGNTREVHRERRIASSSHGAVGVDFSRNTF